MKNIFRKKEIIIITLIGILSGCGKEFLDVKKDKKQVVPKELKDYQAMLDNTHKVMNIASSHGLGMVAVEQYSISDPHWEVLKDPFQKNAYIWADEIYEGKTVEDWNLAYKRILYANLALEGIETIAKDKHNEIEWNEVKGAALFHRAYNFYQLAQLFCPVYTEESKHSPYGLPLRIESSVLNVSKRSSLKETYERILMDLKEAEALLPTLSNFKNRPSKWAVQALLAKVYLVMQDYNNALKHAELCLAIKDDLIDFNSLDHPKSLTDIRLPFNEWGEGNEEVILLNVVRGLAVFDFNRANLDEGLLESYSENDWRKYTYFLKYGGNTVFKGNYAGFFGLYFTGLAIDEVFLTLAECNVRLGHDIQALDALNALLRSRISHYQALEGLSGDALLSKILEERKKELVFRGVRWEDLRRLNLDKSTEETLTRKVNGVEYKLVPNDSKYVWPIPDDVISLSGIEQNKR